MNRLNRKDLGLEHRYPLRVMQFGGGNFLRAFTDWMIQLLNEHTGFNGGVAVIKPTAKGDYGELKAQGGLFTVILKGLEQGELITDKKLVTCVETVINPYKDWTSYLDLAREEQLRFIVSNTTEAGIRFDASDTITDEPPGEFPAKLTRWLHYRFQHFRGDPGKGCIVLPCELIEKNGEVLKATVLQYSEHWNLGAAFTQWLTDANIFCDTLVDRIVSGFPTEEKVALLKALGYEDRLLVEGEYYHSWVIQDKGLVQQELPVAGSGLNIEFVRDLTPYRERKVRILNGAHTIMVPLSLLYGHETVQQAMEDGFTGAFIRDAILEEVIPTLDMDPENLQLYAETIFDRFRNPYLKHALQSIALNSIAKFRVRVLPGILECTMRSDKLPVHLVYAFACLIRLYKGDWEGRQLPLKDDPNILSEFLHIWEVEKAAGVAVQVLGKKEFWGQDLSSVPQLSEGVIHALTCLEQQGVVRGFSHFREAYP